MQPLVPLVFHNLPSLYPPSFRRNDFLYLYHNVPCAVCYVATRETALMIPGRYTCLPNWTREYYGYIMTEGSGGSHRRSTFECVDIEAETTSGGQGYQTGGHFFHVEPRCGSLPCPPYEEEKEMTCVVCTR